MRVVFRTRGNHMQGMGDVMGSLAIAEAFKNNKSETLFIVDNDEEAVQCILRHEHEVKPAEGKEEELSYVESFGPDIIVVNQLKNSIASLKELKRRTKFLVTIDDDSEGAQIADLRFNPLYCIPDSYCDSKFVPLREEFQIINRKRKIIKKEVSSILIALGGSDTYGFTPKIVRALYSISNNVNINVVVGPAFRHTVQLNDAIQYSKRKYSVFRNVQNMVELMFSSDIAVCSGGLTLFELACVGTPAVVLCGELFEEETATSMEKKGFGINLNFGENVDEKTILEAVEGLLNDYDLRLNMSKRGRKIVDGKGAERILDIILKKFKNHHR